MSSFSISIAFSFSSTSAGTSATLTTVTSGHAAIWVGAGREEAGGRGLGSLPSGLRACSAGSALRLPSGDAPGRQRAASTCRACTCATAARCKQHQRDPRAKQGTKSQATCMAMSFTSSWNFSPRATKSVSQFTSTSTPRLQAAGSGGWARACQRSELGDQGWRRSAGGSPQAAALIQKQRQYASTASQIPPHRLPAWM